MMGHEPHNDKWLEFAMRIQAIAQAGLAYGHDAYDRERYEQLRVIATQMMAERTGVSLDRVRDVFCNESGYQTPKVDTRAAVFEGDRILLVHERNDFWSLPGGWCDVDQSVGSNVVKEVREEAGLDVTPTRIIAIQDWRRHNVRNYAYGVVKVFVQCELLGGTFESNLETTGAGWFSRGSLPSNLAVEKCTEGQIHMCFDARDNPCGQTLFD